MVGVPLVVSQPQVNDPTGICIWRRFDPYNKVHVARKHKCYVAEDG